MTRLEFSGKTRDQAAARAAGHCEACGLPFGGARPEYDHILPAAYGGLPTLANCRVLCRSCHAAKTATDVRGIRKADRQRKAGVGAARPKQKINSLGFVQSAKRDPKPDHTTRRALFENVRTV